MKLIAIDFKSGKERQLLRFKKGTLERCNQENNKRSDTKIKHSLKAIAIRRAIE